MKTVLAQVSCALCASAADVPNGAAGVMPDGLAHAIDAGRVERPGCGLGATVGERCGVRNIAASVDRELASPVNRHDLAMSACPRGEGAARV